MDSSASHPVGRRDNGHSGVRLASQKATSRNVGEKFSTYATTSTTVDFALKTSLSLANAPNLPLWFRSSCVPELTLSFVPDAEQPLWRAVTPRNYQSTRVE